MDTRISRCGYVLGLRGLLILLGSLMLTASFDAMASRRFQMALFGSGDPSYTDLSWMSPGESQPAAPRRSILAIDGVYANSNLQSYLSGLGYDWSRIAAVVIDEPYWNATGGPGTGDWSNPCWDPNGPRYASINTTATQLSNAAAAVKNISSRTRFWVNFSEPEVVWMMDSGCPLPLDQAYIDVISLDKYNVSFNDVQPYYNWLVANRPKPLQQFALVPGTFSIVAPTYIDPNWSASLLQGYFDYANSLNSAGWNYPMVWLVAGWPGSSGVLDVGGGNLWAGIFDSNSAPVAYAWWQQFQEQRIDNMTGYMDTTDGYNGILYGWAVDRDVETSPYVDFWADGQYWGGTVANQYRSDIESIHGVGLSGYSFQIPAQFNDGGCHWVVPYAVAPTAEVWNHVELFTVNGNWFCFQ